MNPNWLKQLATVVKQGSSVLIRTCYGVEQTDIGERILAETEQGEDVIRQFHSGHHNAFVIGIDPLWECATIE